MVKRFEVIFVLLVMMFSLSRSTFAGYANCPTVSATALANCLAAGYNNFKVVVLNDTDTKKAEEYVQIAKDIFPEKSFKYEIFLSCNNYNYEPKKIVDGRVIIVLNPKPSKCVP